MSIDYNKLTGTLPTFSNTSCVSYISISHNTLNGTLPREIGNMKALQILYLINNTLTGKIVYTYTHFYTPTCLTAKMTIFCTLIGVIPEEIGGLDKLVELYMNSNKFIGHLPPVIFNMKSLAELSLDKNDLTGMTSQTLSQLTN